MPEFDSRQKLVLLLSLLLDRQSNDHFLVVREFNKLLKLLFLLTIMPPSKVCSQYEVVVLIMTESVQGNLDTFLLHDFLPPLLL